MVCLKLALVPLVFDPLADVPFVLARTLLSHGLSYILIGVLAGLFVARGSSYFVRSWVHVPVLVFLSIGALATVGSANPTLALFGTHVRMLGLTTVVDNVVTYFAVVHLVRDGRGVVAVVASVLVASLAMLGYEVIQLLGMDPFTWTGADTLHRPFSTLGQATTLGEFLSVLSVGAFVLGVLATSSPYWARGFLIAYSIVLLYAAGLTGTRAVALGVAAAAATFVVLVWTKHPSRRARLFSLVSGIGAASVLIILLLATPLGARLLATVESANASATGDAVVGQVEPSTATRLAIYDIALRMVSTRPLAGYGPDNFAAALPAFRPDAAPPDIRQSIATSPHSWIAAVAIGTGLTGLVAFVAVVAATALVLFRSPYNGVGLAAAVIVVAYLAAGAVTINALETDTLFWLGIAAIVGAGANQPRMPPQPEQHSARARRPASNAFVRAWTAWALVAGSIAMTATALPALEASHLAKQSASFRAPATVVLAIDLATRATRLDSNRAEYWQALALAYVVAVRWADASVAFQRAAKLAPYDIRFLTDDIQIQILLANGGDTKALERAAQLADRAILIDPKNPNGYFNRAIVAFRRSDLLSALESIERALLLDPHSVNGQLYVAAAQIYVAATQSATSGGRFDDALLTARRGIAQLGSTVQSVPLRLELARALSRSGRRQEAIDELDTALLIAPGDQSLLQLKQDIQRSP